MADSERVILCSKCKRPLSLVKGTYLCVICDFALLWDLVTPNTRSEEKDWVNRNLGVSNNDKNTKN